MRGLQCGRARPYLIARAYTKRHGVNVKRLYNTSRETKLNIDPAKLDELVDDAVMESAKGSKVV